MTDGTPLSRDTSSTASLRPSVGLRLVLFSVLPYLAAITIFGKGPTYVGIPPVFWGEVVLAVSLAGVLMHRGIEGIFVPRPLTLSFLILGFQTFGFVSTALCIPGSGLDAVRDAAAWYYSIFYFVGLAAAGKKEVGDGVWKFLQWVWVVAMVWAVGNFLTGGSLSIMGPTIPFRGVNLFSTSGSEMVQHCVLGACIVVGFGFPSHPGWWRLTVLTVSVLGIALQAMTPGRGAKLAGALAMLLSATLGWTRHDVLPYSRRMIYLFLLILLAILPLALVLEKDIAGALKLDRFEEGFDVRGTSAFWRQVWWEHLIEETVQKNPFFGLGFGQNLGEYSPFLNRDHLNPWPIRSPHNYNITIFARMGFLGLTLLLLILLLGLGRLVYAVHQPRNQDHRSELLFWVAMLSATWVNASFGVLMEGPVLGVWFWFALGFATAREITGRASAHENINPT
jgi:hypothetical protein